MIKVKELIKILEQYDSELVVIIPRYSDLKYLNQNEILSVKANEQVSGEDGWLRSASNSSKTAKDYLLIG